MLAEKWKSCFQSLAIVVFCQCWLEAMVHTISLKLLYAKELKQPACIVKSRMIFSALSLEKGLKQNRILKATTVVAVAKLVTESSKVEWLILIKQACRRSNQNKAVTLFKWFRKQVGWAGYLFKRAPEILSSRVQTLIIDFFTFKTKCRRQQVETGMKKWEGKSSQDSFILIPS